MLAQSSAKIRDLLDRMHAFYEANIYPNEDCHHA